ncbi:hypothetical protein [Sneathiella chinensis]|nr:hypothetical protein [Sneathiella chinensis]
MPSDLKIGCDRTFATGNSNYFVKFILNKVRSGYSIEPLIDWLVEVLDRRRAAILPVWDYPRYGGSRIEAKYRWICYGMTSGIVAWAKSLTDLSKDQMLHTLQTALQYQGHQVVGAPIDLSDNEWWRGIVWQERLESSKAEEFDRCTLPQGFHFTLGYLEAITEGLLQIQARNACLLVASGINEALRALCKLVMEVKAAMFLAFNGEYLDSPDLLPQRQQTVGWILQREREAENRIAGLIVRLEEEGHSPDEPPAA